MSTDRTIHGWPVIKAMGDGRLVLLPIPGVPDRRMRLLRSVAGYLLAFAGEYHRKIAPLNVGIFDDWSWSPPRDGRAAPGQTSDHCAGVAIDLNATREGSQAASTLKWWRNPIRVVKLRRLRKRYPLLEWGGDYTTFRDPMHWTFRKGVTVAQIRAAMKAAGISDTGHRV